MFACLCVEWGLRECKCASVCVKGFVSGGGLYIKVCESGLCVCV